MLAMETIELLDFGVDPAYKTGKYDAEYMTSDSDVLATLTANGYSATLSISGNGRFSHNGKLFTTEAELLKHPELVSMIREDKLDLDETPIYFIEIHDAYGDMLHSEPAEIYSLPTPLETKSLLMTELSNLLFDLDDEMKEEDLKLAEKISEFSCFAIQLQEGVAPKKPKSQLTTFIKDNDHLFSAIGYIDMSTEEDDYGQKWLTVMFQCESPEARSVIRKEVFTYGDVF